MKKRSPEVKKESATFVKRMIASSFALILGCAVIFSLTHAWLDRTVDETSGTGFSLRNSGQVMGKTYTMETYYYGLDMAWHLITTDYERFEETEAGTGTDWSIAWDEACGVLIPGSKTEFKTVITNLMPYDLSVSLYLDGVTVDPALKELVIIGASEPQVNLFAPTDTSFFVDPGSDQVITAGLLPLCYQETLAAKTTMNFRWYVNTSSDVVGGSFPVLQDKTTHTPITDGKGHYYYVNQVDENGTPTEAFLCSARGVVVFDPTEAAYTAYKPYKDAAYSQTESGQLSFGAVSDMVRISGIYAAIG